MDRRDAVSVRGSLHSIVMRSLVLGGVIGLTWCLIGVWCSLQFRPADVAFEASIVEWLKAAWLPALILGSFGIAAFVDWRTRGGEQQVQGALAAIAIRTGGTGCLVLAIVLLVADVPQRNQQLVAIAIVYVVALIVDTCLWLRQIRNQSV